MLLFLIVIVFIIRSAHNTLYILIPFYKTLVSISHGYIRKKGSREINVTIFSKIEP